MRPVFSLVVVVAAVAIGIVTTEGGNVAYYVDLPSFFLVFAASGAYLCLAFPAGDLNAWAKAGFLSRDVTADEKGRALRVCASERRVVLVSGLAGGLVGLVLMLQNLDDPSKLGSGLAVSIVAPLYAVLLAEIFLEAVWARISRAKTLDPPEGPR